MNKSKFLTVLSVGMLLINLVLLGFIFTHQNDRGPNGKGPRDLIIKKLHFDKSQITAYDGLIKWHRSEIQKADSEKIQLKNQLYHNLNNTNVSAVDDSLLNKIAAVQMHIEAVHYKHFQDIKNLCKPEQSQYYIDLTKDIAALFSPPKRDRLK